MKTNVHGVAKRQWKKWNQKERDLFNALYSFSVANPWVFSHPKSPELSKAEWDTVAWNHSWMAADLMKELRDAKL